jgi:hypothetical protein
MRLCELRRRVRRCMKPSGESAFPVVLCASTLEHCHGSESASLVQCANSLGSSRSYSFFTTA